MDTRADTATAEDAQERLNAEVWAKGEFVDFYATRRLRTVETMLLERHRDALGGRLLELGCGAGALTGRLCEVARSVHAVDISPAMVAYCRRTYPKATFSEGDLRDLSRFERGSFDAVVAPFNVLDVLGDAERRRVLEEIHAVLVLGGLLIMSSHNRGYAPRIGAAMRAIVGDSRRPLESIRHLPRRLRNRRRLVRLEREEDGYALVNDEAHDFSVLHYYISRDAQEHQFAEQGFELIECLDREGRLVAAGEAAAHCPELHYVARRSA
jgi:SAM-dependent methyltransferase